MEFPRQEYWSGLPFPPPGDLSDPGIEFMSSALHVGSLPLSHQGSPWDAGPLVKNCFSPLVKNCFSVLIFFSFYLVEGRHSQRPPLWTSIILFVTFKRTLSKKLYVWERTLEIGCATTRMSLTLLKWTLKKSWGSKFYVMFIWSQVFFFKVARLFTHLTKKTSSLCKNNSEEYILKEF